MTMKSRCLIPFLYLLLIAACRTPSASEPEYNTLLRSDEPLSNEELESALAAIESHETPPETRWSLFERLCTDHFRRFQHKLPKKGYRKSFLLPDGTKYLSGVPSSFEDISSSSNQPSRLIYLLPIFHEPEEKDQVKYFTFMLDFMESPLRENRKLNGLCNIKRVMSESHYHRNLNEPEMIEVRSRLYPLVEDEEKPDSFRKEFKIWLELVNQATKEKKDDEDSSHSSGLRFFNFNPVNENIDK